MTREIKTTVVLYLLMDLNCILHFIAPRKQILSVGVALLFSACLSFRHSLVPPANKVLLYNFIAFCPI